MKSLGIVLIVGFILLYFVDAALKIDLFNWEMFFHSGIRFFTGFIIIGIGFLYEHKLKFKLALYLVLGLILADDILDYFRNATQFSVELILYGIYMLIWGSVTGYFFIRIIKHRQDNN